MPRAPLKWGVLGVAQIATTAFAPAIVQSKTSVLHGVASRESARASAFATQFGVMKTYESYDALIEDPDVEAIYIPLPNTLHYQWILKCIEAGKHVLCEKPLVLHAPQVDDIQARSTKAGLTVMEAFMYRFHRRVVRLKELLKDGVIGDVRVAKAFYCYKLDAAADVLSGAYAKNIRLSESLGGGALLDVGCYCLDALQFYLGNDPISITAWSSANGANDVELRAGGLIEFASGRVGEFFCAMDTFGGGHVEIWGSDGKITLPAAFRLRSTQTELPLILETSSGSTTEIFSYADQYQAEIDAFASAVIAGSEAPISLSETRRTVGLLEAARTSWQKAATIRLA